MPSASAPPHVISATLIALAASCSAGLSSNGVDTGHHGATSARLSPTTSAAAPLVGAGPSAIHVPLGEPREIPLPFTIQPVPGAASVLFVSQFAGDRTAWVRRLDGRASAPGPLLGLVDESVHGAFDWSDGRFTLVTSDGERLCLATYRADADRPEARGCAAVSPSVIAPLGDHLLLVEIATQKAGGSRPGGKSAAAATPARPKTPPRPQRDDKKKKGARPGSPAKKKPPAPAPRRPPPSVTAEIRVRSATREGAIEAEARPTGLRFEQPLAGMGLVDARSRPPGIDLLWFETAPKRRTRSPLGSARLMAGSLRADGSADLKSRVAVIDGDLEYGALSGHRAPRLAGTAAGTAYVGLDSKSQCEAIRILPALSRLSPPPALCAVDPDRLAAPGALSPAEITAMETILAEDPRRSTGQPKIDPGLVAWAGDRAWFLRGGALRSAARADGSGRAEPPPFLARRSRIAWGVLAPDGEGIALTGDAVVHLEPKRDAGSGEPEAASGALAVELRPLEAAGAQLQRAPLAGALWQSADIAVDRRRAARIGASWWVARGDVVRLFPDASAPAALRGKAPPDAAVLVGGPARGVLVEVAGEALRLTSIDASGDAAPLGGPPVVSPVRVGLDACERGGGGALIAGVSAADASRVVAFAVDAEGHVGDAHVTPLPIGAGDLAVRLTALPGGGALLTDLDRRHVVWLDDAGRPVADAPAPLEESAAVCLDGRPARARIADPTPGRFTAIADLAAPGTCIVGEPVWTRSGALVWLGSAVKGADAIAEARIALAGSPVTPPRPSPIEPDGALRPAPSPACPSEMVSVGGRLCVDRFEATIVDQRTLEPLSPDYPTTPNLLDFVVGEWSTARERTGGAHARAFPLPFLPPSRIGQKIDPVAVPRLLARPNGYVTGLVAEAACAAAGKRLCSLDEFILACRGEDDTLFPYGDTFEDGVCNVFREEHPAALLHDNASIGHLDPRLNRVGAKGRPLYQRAGESPACRSRWGNDAIYDMVGNLDEWIDEGGGAFAGGFYARSTRAGCEALVTAHPRSYLDYSTGVRCCKGAGGAGYPPHPASSASASTVFQLRKVDMEPSVASK